MNNLDCHACLGEMNISPLLNNICSRFDGCFSKVAFDIVNQLVGFSNPVIRFSKFRRSTKDITPFCEIMSTLHISAAIF